MTLPISQSKIRNPPSKIPNASPVLPHPLLATLMPMTAPTTDLRRLVAEAVELTGADAPLLMADDAPVLDLARIPPADDTGWYIVGLIGGKEVGKSALVNALAGQAITQSTAWGEGTQQVIAYVHTSRAAAIEQFLQREVPGRWRIVTHNIDAIARQVLLDLPDIDSHFREHVALTRHMLRFMLYPIWVQSVEKYADRQVQDLLRQVAAGNAPENFIFCLNKVDQVAAAHGASGTTNGRQDVDPIEELRDDFARRAARVLQLDQPPRVYAVSATQPQAFDLPELRQTLSRQRSGESVSRAIAQAGAQQVKTVIGWVREQHLPRRLEQLRRLHEQAADAIQARIGPMVEQRAIAERDDDAASRLRLIDDALSRRVRAWPLLSVLHAMLWPILALIRGNVASAGGQQHRSAWSQQLATAVQTTFAQLQQAQPIMSELYAHNRLWEAQPAEQEASRLGFAIEQSLRQRDRQVAERAGRSLAIFAPVRWLLTIGALLWFVLVQPVLELLLPVDRWPGLTDLAKLAVRVLSVQVLLEAAVFALLWYFMLWLVLRWRTQRRVERWLGCGDGSQDPGDPRAATVEWLDDLLVPIQQRISRIEALLQQVDELQESAR